MKKLAKPEATFVIIAVFAWIIVFLISIMILAFWYNTPEKNFRSAEDHYQAKKVSHSNIVILKLK